MHQNPERTVISRRVRLSGGRYLHVVESPGQGRPLVLLHGLLGSAASWGEFVQASRRPCLALDLPGFGNSSPARQPRLSAYAEDVAEALRQLCVQSCTVVGHSLGGAVATALAESMRDEIRSLVLCAPAGFGRLPRAELAALPLVRHLAAKSLPHVLTNSWLAGPVCATLVACGLTPSIELRRKLAADIVRVGPGARAAVQALAAAGRSPAAFHRRLVNYDGPVTALWGDRDTLVPRSHLIGLLAALPQAGIQIWPGAGHHLHRDRPHELAALICRATEEPHATRLGAGPLRPQIGCRSANRAWTAPADTGARRHRANRAAGTWAPARRAPAHGPSRYHAHSSRLSWL